MSKRTLTLLLTSVVASALVWLIRTPLEKPRISHAPAAALPKIAGDPKALQSGAPTASLSRQIPGGPPEPSDPRWTEREMKRRVDRDYEWKMRINFYGRVVDEREQPVPGATIVAQWSDLSPNGASSETTYSDRQGFFSISGKTGRATITIRLSKDGYYTPNRQQISFDYAGFWEANYYEPNPGNPVLFHLRKKNVGEAWSSGEVRLEIPASGTPVCVDLLNGGRVSPAGQLEISAVTNTEKYPPRMFDWRATISVRDGGLLEHDIEFPFEAPINGYVERVEFNMPATAPDWRRTVDKTYFIQFGSPPRYGRIKVRFNGASQKVSVNYAVNPDGSRNLEQGETQQASVR